MKVTRTPWTCAREDVERLKGLGLRDEDILDAVSVVGLLSHENRVADALGIPMNPEYSEMTRKPGVP